MKLIDVECYSLQITLVRIQFDFFLSDKYCHAFATTTDANLKIPLKCADFPQYHDEAYFRGCFKQKNQDEYFCQLDRSSIKLDKVEISGLGICSHSCPKHPGKRRS